MISERPYKHAFSHEQAVHAIIEERGSHFDPDIVDAFLTIENKFKAIALKFANNFC